MFHVSSLISAPARLAGFRSTLVALLFATALAGLPLTAAAQPAPPVDSLPAATGSATPADSTAPADSASQADNPDWTVRDGWERTSTYVRTHGTDYVGEPDGDWPYHRRSALYTDAPPFRYNRTEGLVFGLQRSPLDLSSGDRARFYGQIGYATALRDVRATAGAEVKAYSRPSSALKVGASVYRNTATEDDWKTSYLENSLAGLVFGHDFFDYYQARGASAYLVQELPATMRISAGARTEIHEALDRGTTWSIFDGNGFPTNPQAANGRVNALTLAFDAGRVDDLGGLPTGGAVRVTAELADGFDEGILDDDTAGNLQYNRYVADGRVYLPTSRHTRLAVRLRGGYATSGTPIQKQFTLGGIGSVRGYGQNAFRGTKAVLGNAEVIIDGATIVDGVLDDVFLSLHADAGWTGTPGERFRMDDVVPAAGFGIGLDERSFRLDVTWPLRDVNGSGYAPSIWLRITPNF
jgi:hypothetical protein